MEFNDRIKTLLTALEDKYKLEEQEMESYLEGLLHADYINYWDYIQTDTLLSLQKMRSVIPDEMIFICYHQITELYFKLCIWEIQQILNNTELTTDFFIARLKRMNNYFRNLTRSFEIMVDGMEPQQFLKFRLTLMPASGFQSAQYRMLEIASTDLINLVEKSHRQELQNAEIGEKYQFMYWRYGATEVATGRKSLTLRMFENKYENDLIDWAKMHEPNNLRTAFKKLKDSENYEELATTIKEWDLNVNINWPMMHLKSAGRYLGRTDKGIPATGGTNWEKYLPPRFQQRVFYPELWSQEELDSWGMNVTKK